MEQYKSLGRTASENTHLNPAASGTRRRIKNSWWWFRWMVCSIQSWRRLNPWWWGSEKWLLDDHRRIRLSSSRCTKSQTVHAERRNISYSNEVHRRYQNNNTHTSLDVFLEKQIEDYWNVDGEKELSDAWTGFTRFILLNERPPDGYTWSERRLTRKQNTSRPDDIWPDMWTRVSDAAKKVAKQRWAIEKPKLDNARQLRGIHFIETRRWRVQAHNQSRSKKVGSTDDSSDALQNTNKKQWEDPPQCWETQDKICLYCWWRRKHETKARRAVHKSHQTKIVSLRKGWILWIITVLFTSSFRCLKQWKFQMRRQQWKKHGTNWRKFRHGSWQESETRKMWSLKQGIRNKKKKGLYPSRDLHWIVPPILLRRVPLPHQVRLHRKVRGLLELRGSKVSKMSGLETPSDAQTKYLGPEPLLCHAKACNWVPVDGWNPCFAELWPTAEISDKEKAYFADGDKVWVLAAEGRCFPTPESIVNLSPVARKTRAGSLLLSTVLNDEKESGACVSLLGKCHRLAMTACTENRPTWHTTPRSQADVTVRRFPWQSMRTPLQCVYTEYTPTPCMTYIQSVHKHARMWMRACGSSQDGWVVSSLRA